jgi:hypothetical protein
MVRDSIKDRLMRLSLLIPLLTVLPLQAADKLPQEVQKFIQQRDTCEHFRGEVLDPEERERMREVSLQIDKFCRGTDQRLASLKKKYRSSTVVQRRLAQYEPQIEPGSQPSAKERR